MLNISIQINLNSNLNVVSAELERAIEATLETIGLYVSSEAKVRTPVDTGLLRSSIHHIVDLQKKKVEVGTNVSYAEIIEVGSSTRTPQPYLVPAVEENIQNINRLAKSTFEQFGQ
ncbi:HK97-gp10 family putative phage morphogenesis protein [Psychrobacillus sp. BM2]|uniref:HK97-gp10 family putative phage morphogenesis protein n=1 Tax=Psychrobacillus sp. BM2 TaxID=3400421 RepID=UPI003B01666A